MKNICFFVSFLALSQVGFAREPNPSAVDQIIYEVQVRAANACHPNVGSREQKTACENKISPQVSYRAKDSTCPYFESLKQIKLGTFEDMLEGTADYRQGITLNYIQTRVGANTIWLMPIFPNNDEWSLPDPCDNLGSPYAVRDYMHVQGSLSRSCILQGKDEHSAEACYGNDSLDQFIRQAHARGIKVLLDLAFNHLGHNYNLFDTVEVESISQKLSRGESEQSMWDFRRTYDAALLYPKLTDTEQKLAQSVHNNKNVKDDFDQFKQHCPNVVGMSAVKLFGQWRNALAHEKSNFSCTASELEFSLPGFYLGQNGWDSSQRAGDNYTNNWRDVKFLFLQKRNVNQQFQYLRNREYFFKVMNYWTSRGIDGYRLDHTTDEKSGIDAEFWHYLTQKNNFYAKARGQNQPLYLAEEFHDQGAMQHAVDIMTEGYVGDITARGKPREEKNAGRFEYFISKQEERFHKNSLVMTALETHDEKRLVDGTLFDPWIGAGFWGVGLSTWSTPMILMGQEFGETWGLGFKRSDFIRSRFMETEHYYPYGPHLTNFYHLMIEARKDFNNRALKSDQFAFLHPASSPSHPDDRIFAQMKWKVDAAGPNVVFTFNNLWTNDVHQTFFVTDEWKQAAFIRPDLKYQLRNIFSGHITHSCSPAIQLFSSLNIHMQPDERILWLRLEQCQ